MSNVQNIPSLAWLDLYRDSISRAIGEEIHVRTVATVNPLEYDVFIILEEPKDKKILNLLALIFKEFAEKNDVIVQNKEKRTPSFLSIRVALKQRLGKEKKDSP